MKSVILLASFILHSTVALALDADDFAAMARQMSNRGWNEKAASLTRVANLMDYSSNEILSQSRTFHDDAATEFASNSWLELSQYYPLLEIESDGHRVDVLESMLGVANNQTALEEWSDLLITLGTDRWSDNISGSCNSQNPINDPDCGRKTKATYITANLSFDQIESIENMKNIALSDLNLINKWARNYAFGPELPRLFQIIFDSRSIHQLLKSRFDSNMLSSSDVVKKRALETLRAIIFQAFSGDDGELINSDLKEIVLEKTDCFNEPANMTWSCHLDYVKGLFLDPSLSSANGFVSNLLLDKKMVIPFTESILRVIRDEHGEEIDQGLLEEILRSYYYFLTDVYALDSESPIYHNKLPSLLAKQCQFGIKEAISSGNVLNLKLAKLYGKLARFLELQ